MQTGQPSQTARGAAAYRAIHQTLDGGRDLQRSVRLKILDDEARVRREAMAANPALRPMRLFIAARSRFSEDTLAGCVARGVRQIVVLGAGLDTFALRNPYAGQGVRVFEVDYPATQAWKRECLKQAGLAIPPSLTFAAVDFERQSLAEGLMARRLPGRLPCVLPVARRWRCISRARLSHRRWISSPACRTPKSCSTTPSPLKTTRPIAAPSSWHRRRRGGARRAVAQPVRSALNIASCCATRDSGHRRSRPCRTVGAFLRQCSNTASVSDRAAHVVRARNSAISGVNSMC